MKVEGDRIHDDYDDDDDHHHERRFALLQAIGDFEYVKEMHGGFFNLFVTAFGEEGDRWDMFKVVDGEFPEMKELINYDGFVVSGSPSDAYGDECWVIKLCFLLQTLDSMAKKVLGICFGHQVLSRALGGKVGKACSGWDVGLREVKFMKNLPACKFLGEITTEEIPASLCVIECHQDEVWEVPLGAEVIAFSDKTGVEMFAIGNHIMGIQGHPEYTNDILSVLIDNLLNNGSIEKGFAEEAKFGMQVTEPDRKWWEKICRNFLRGG